jgi:Asp-tRNA(Asn)/Glu-tRNA(Gln) amidotransferase A subunit family amidase
MTYDPLTYEPLTFADAPARFLAGSDTPRDYLERCITRIEEHEPVVRAWASLRVEAARADADAATKRYRAGQPLSAIDGMPIGIKDLISTKDLPTGMGIAGNENHFTGDDSASVQALRQAGAVIVGKTTTTELGGGWPSVTTNPFDPSRTPGGSSSGSAAAVAARMVPATLGTQVGGSILRPAAFCGNVAIKPTMGAIHRGERLGLSHACIGVHAGTLQDMWNVAVEVASRAGGDPGYPGLYGQLPVPHPATPRRLAIMQGPGWEATEPRSRALFETMIAALEKEGVDCVNPQDDRLLADFHATLPEGMRAVATIVMYENRSLLANLMTRMPDKLSPASVAQYEAGLRLTLADYRNALATREELRRRHKTLDGSFDAVISLAAPGPAPLINDPHRPSGQLATGNPIYNIYPSLLGAPAISLPLLALDQLPLGIQIMGQPHKDQLLTALAAWLLERVAPIVG